MSNVLTRDIYVWKQNLNNSTNINDGKSQGNNNDLAINILHPWT